MNRIVLVFCIILPLFSLSQTTEKSVIAANGTRIGFLEFRPSDYSSGKHPLIIFLHGIGEKGNGTTQLKNVNCCGIPSYIRRGNKMRFTWQGKTESFVVLSPQLSKKYAFWQPYYTDEMIKYAKANLNIDPDRIFVTGLSMGGGGTWNFASSSQIRAEQLAGIAPVVAPCMMTNGCNIANANLPVMAIHVWDDRDAPASCTINAIKSINSCNPDVTPNLIMYASGGHYVWVKRAFDTAHEYQNPNMYEWFLAQNRKFAPNHKPVARAGKDQSITTADASITLSATASSDPDGSIVRYIWTKLSGPKKGTLSGTNTATLKITDLSVTGVYKYQLKVIDNRAEWSLDTVLVNVAKGEPSPNVLPLAKAGTDTSIVVGSDVTLNGSASTDPDGSITGYLWTKAQGPDSFALADAWNARTAVSGLIAGTYTFRLKVSDNRGAETTDDITITVKGPDQGTDSIPDQPNQPGNVTTNAIVVYPNPAPGNITLSLNTSERGNAVALIYDNTGRMVRKISFIKYYLTILQPLSTSDLPRGAFFIDVLIGKNGRYRTKFIRQ
jgi:poly(3-hydroxybutyrate) depolymerase